MSTTKNLHPDSLIAFALEALVEETIESYGDESLTIRGAVERAMPQARDLFPVWDDEIIRAQLTSAFTTWLDAREASVEQVEALARLMKAKGCGPDETVGDVIERL
ncbi:MAG: hypothetical protein JOY71_23310 [Acetobacteraceae bacterium]|nr:hypothetical protein [Acetobacteraceae bacterium]MBV8525012.1 hypothetical protein [Acetobacteraceae bacterium]